MASASSCMLSTAKDTCSIPKFTLESLLHCLSEILGRASGILYALEGYPALAVREIQLDSFTEDIIKDIQCNLLVHTRLSTHMSSGVTRYSAMESSSTLL